MIRSQPLRRKAWLPAGQPLRRVPVRRPRPRDTGPTPAVRALVRERDGRRCVYCGIPEQPRYPAQVHHRKPRRAGGTRDPRINSAANLVLLHADCHGLVETRFRWVAIRDGLILHANADPAEVPVLYPDGSWWLLTDNGQRIPATAPEEAA